MAAHGLTQKEWRRPEAGRRSAQIIQLGWSHFWLLTGVLAGMLSLFALIFLTARAAV